MTIRARFKNHITSAISPDQIRKKQMNSQSLGFVNITVYKSAAELLPGYDERALEVVRYDQFVLNLAKPQSELLMKLHAGLGVCGEAGELADAIKSECVYGKGLNRKNIVEELGDLRWYMQMVQNLYGISDQEVLQTNADKLAERYVKLKYSDEAAIARADKAGNPDDSDK